MSKFLSKIVGFAQSILSFSRNLPTAGSQFDPYFQHYAFLVKYSFSFMGFFNLFNLFFFFFQKFARQDPIFLTFTKLLFNIKLFQKFTWRVLITVFFILYFSGNLLGRTQLPDYLRFASFDSFQEIYSAATDYQHICGRDPFFRFGLIKCFSRQFLDGAYNYRIISIFLQYLLIFYLFIICHFIFLDQKFTRQDSVSRTLLELFI